MKPKVLNTNQLGQRLTKQFDVEKRNINLKKKKWRQIRFEQKQTNKQTNRGGDTMMMMTIMIKRVKLSDWKKKI